MKTTGFTSLLLLTTIACSKQDDLSKRVQPTDTKHNTEKFRFSEVPQASDRNIFAFAQEDDSSDRLQQQWHDNWKLVGTFATEDRSWQAIVQSSDGTYIVVPGLYTLPNSDLTISTIDKNSVTISNRKEDSFVVRLE